MSERMWSPEELRWLSATAHDLDRIMSTREKDSDIYLDVRLMIEGETLGHFTAELGTFHYVDAPPRGTT